MALAARDESNSFSYWDAQYERVAVGCAPGCPTLTRERINLGASAWKNPCSMLRRRRLWP